MIGRHFPCYADIPRGRYQVIAADPPWVFKTRSGKGLRGRPQHYARMTKEQIMAMPVADLAAPDCHLFLWVTTPNIKWGIATLEAWGFTYSAFAFTWVKLNPRSGLLFFDQKSFHKGQGYTTRKNVEICLLGRRGKPRRLSNNVAELIIAPRRQHSRKPEEFYERVTTYADGPRLELFARQVRPEWGDCWGDQSELFNVRQLGDPARVRSLAAQ